MPLRALALVVKAKDFLALEKILNIIFDTCIISYIMQICKHGVTEVTFVPSSVNWTGKQDNADHVSTPVNKM